MYLGSLQRHLKYNTIHSNLSIFHTVIEKIHILIFVIQNYSKHIEK